MGELYRRGVPVTINSDDPHIQDTDLTDDYIKAVRYFDFDVEDLVQLNLTALNSAFLKPAEKKRTIELYKNKVDEFKDRFLP